MQGIGFGFLVAVMSVQRFRLHKILSDSALRHQQIAYLCTILLKNVDASSDVPISGLGFAPHLVFSCRYQVLLVIQWRINCLDRDKQVGSAVLGTAALSHNVLGLL